ncbi:MAG: hypothetical protein O7D32_11695, partial [bacterium]|nr:hypothetical protein [bacterium]
MKPDAPDQSEPSRPEADAPGVRPEGRPRLEWISWLVCWIPYALLTWKFRFVCDDAFISFRFARNWVHGHGLRYNLGDHLPVEGYSNFLWVCVAAVFEWAGVDPRIWVSIVSFAAGSLLLLLVFRTLHRCLGMSLWVVVPACLFLGCSPALAVWSTSGLETAAFALLMFLVAE